MKLMFNIYNSSNTDMKEIRVGSISLVLSSPAYNCGGKFENWVDLVPFQEYKAYVTAVLSECNRVLQNDGFMIMEISDTSYDGAGNYHGVAGLYGAISRQLGLSLVSRHYAMTSRDEQGYETPEHRWSDDYVSTAPNHSPTHQILVFRKGDYEFEMESCKVLHYTYPSDEEGHPCPFSMGLVKFVLDQYYQGGVVLDPCCGTARLGREVLKRGGSFVGYDISETYCRTARELLEEVEGTL